MWSSVTIMDKEELWEHYRKETNGNVRERTLMIIWLEEGKTTYEVGELLNCPQSKVAYWKKRFEEEGLVGLRTRERSGKPSRLSNEDEERIRERLETVNSWQTKWVRDLIHKEAGVVYSERHVVRLLHAWGFGRIVPRKGHILADEREQEQFSKKPGSYWTLSRRTGE